MIWAAALVSTLLMATRAASATPSPALPPPKIALTVTPGSPQQWTMRLENTGDLPLRVVADASLLTLEIAVPAGVGPTKKGKPAPAHTVFCTLPSDMRPAGDAARGLVLAPGKAYVEKFDPRMFCFGAREAEALVRDARMVAHYGFAPPRSTSAPKRTPSKAPAGPFAVSPVLDASGASPTVGSLKEIDAGSAVDLSEDAVASAATAPVSPGGTPSVAADSGLALTLPARTDSARGAETSVVLTLKNVSARTAVAYFRPQAVAFEVTGPAGDFTCAAPGSIAIREFFSTLRPRGQSQLSMLLAASCPDLAFGSPGLYNVRPHLDTRRIMEMPPALHAIAGDVAGTSSLVRVRHGQGNFSRPPPIAE